MLYIVDKYRVWLHKQRRKEMTIEEALRNWTPETALEFIDTLDDDVEVNLMSGET